MKKLTDFLGKPVISLYEGNIEGYVKNVVFEKGMKKIKYFVLFEDNDFQDEKMLESSKIYKYLSDAIIIKNNSALELKKDEVFNIENHINCKVYESNGKYIGLVPVDLSAQYILHLQADQLSDGLWRMTHGHLIRSCLI